MNVQEHVLLKTFTTFHVGGPARYYITVTSPDELVEAISFAQIKKFPMYVLGGGSNLLIADTGYNGVIIKMQIEGVDVSELGGDLYEVTAGAGEWWDDVVAFTVNQGLWGIENLSAIPGSVGAAPVNNIGAYGVELKRVIQWVEVFDTSCMMLVKLSAQECAFGYRDSIFKKAPAGRYIITRVCMLLRKNGTPVTQYRDIREALKGRIQTPTLDEMRRIVCSIRAQKFPSLKTHGTAGSFFKNPVIPVWKFMLLKWKYPRMKGFISGYTRVKVSAAWILDHVCGLKGVRRGPVGLHDKQPLVLVAHAGAKARDIKSLAEHVQGIVYDKTGIHFEPEVVYLGFDDM